MNHNIFEQIKNLKIRSDPDWQDVLKENEFKYKLRFDTNDPIKALSLMFYTIKTMRYEKSRKMLSIVYNGETKRLKIHNTKEFSEHMTTLDYDKNNIFNCLLQHINTLTEKGIIKESREVIYYKYEHETFEFILLYNDKNIYVIQKKTWPDLIYEKFISPIIIPKFIGNVEDIKINLNFAELVAYKYFDDIYYSIIQFVKSFNYYVNKENYFFVFSSNCYVGQVIKHAHLHYKIPNITLSVAQNRLTNT